MAVKGPVWGTRNSYLSPGVIGVLHKQCIPLNLVRLSCIILTFSSAPPFATGCISPENAKAAEDRDVLVAIMHVPARGSRPSVNPAHGADTPNVLFPAFVAVDKWIGIGCAKCCVLFFRSFTSMEDHFFNLAAEYPDLPCFLTA